jgi:hypothetical protein
MQKMPIANVVCEAEENELSGKTGQLKWIGMASERRYGYSDVESRK